MKTDEINWLKDKIQEEADIYGDGGQSGDTPHYKAILNLLTGCQECKYWNTQDDEGDVSHCYVCTDGSELTIEED